MVTESDSQRIRWSKNQMVTESDTSPVSCIISIIKAVTRECQYMWTLMLSVELNAFELTDLACPTRSCTCTCRRRTRRGRGPSRGGRRSGRTKSCRTRSSRRTRPMKWKFFLDMAKSIKPKNIVQSWASPTTWWFTQPRTRRGYENIF